MACGRPGADNAHRFSVVGVRDNEDALAAGHSYRQKPPLLARVVGIGKSCRERVTQHGCRFVEIDPVLPKVDRGFLRIPREDHTDEYTLTRVGDLAVTRRS
jgi:hypothetical protein